MSRQLTPLANEKFLCLTFFKNFIVATSFCWFCCSYILFSLWLLASVYLTSQAESIIFYNQVSWAPIPAYGYKLDFVKNSRGKNLSFWFFENEYSDEVILYLHGNTGRLAYLFPELIKKANILSPAYPRYHESEGKPSVDSVYETAFLAYEWLVQKKVSLKTRLRF